MAVNDPSSLGLRPWTRGGGGGAFTAISPRQHVLTIIIITSHLIGPHDVAMNTA